MSNKVVFIGCGDIATRAALKLQENGTEVLCVRRHPENLPENLPSAAADVLNPPSLGFLANTDADTVVYSLAASAFNEGAYINAYVTGLRNTIESCDFTKIKRFIFVSSTAVYHQNDGSQVDETSPTKPHRFNGTIMLQAEQMALATGVGTALRLSGIYGPGRERLIARVKNGQCTEESTTTYTNRIHSDDCGGVVAHLATLDSVPDIVLGSDSKPATAVNVETFIANQLKLEKRYAAPSASTPKRIAGSKRCDNSLLINSGYTFRYPDYQSGYRDLIDCSL